MAKCYKAVPNLRELEVDWEPIDPYLYLLEDFSEKRGVHLKYKQVHPRLPISGIKKNSTKLA